MKLNNAFTLVEILLVIVIVGIVLALAAPNFSKGYSRFQLEQTADDLLSVSRWAQAMAIGQERIFALSLAGDHRSYRLERNNNDDNDSQDLGPVNGALGRRHTIAADIHLDAPKDRIEFYPDGTIDPITIQLVCPRQKITLSTSEVRGKMTKVESE